MKEKHAEKCRKKKEIQGNREVEALERKGQFIDGRKCVILFSESFSLFLM